MMLERGGVTLAPGYRFGAQRQIAAGEIAEFASLCGDFNPLHHDADAAARTRFGGIVACGPHTMSVFSALVASHFSPLSAMVGLDFSFRFLRVVRAGDLLQMEWELQALEYSPKLRGHLLELQGRVQVEARDVLHGKGQILLLDEALD